MLRSQCILSGGTRCGYPVAGDVNFHPLVKFFLFVISSTWWEPSFRFLSYILQLKNYIFKCNSTLYIWEIYFLVSFTVSLFLPLSFLHLLFYLPPLNFAIGNHPSFLWLVLSTRALALGELPTIPIFSPSLYPRTQL